MKRKAISGFPCITLANWQTRYLVCLATVKNGRTLSFG